MDAPQHGAPMQFETAVPQVPLPDAGHTVTCASCGRSIADEYFDAGGQPVCEACSRAIAEAMETPKGLGALARAGVFGLAAALVGAMLYYAVIAITNFEIGIVAIAIGYMVGYAVRAGARGRGGRRFQVMAVVLTYWAVGLAYVPFVLQSAPEETSEAATAAAGESSDTAAATVPAATADPDADASNPVVAAAVLLVLSVALPVLIVAGSLPGGLISAAIIAFGMHQAYRMTAAARVEFTGPYRVGAPPSAAS